MPSIETAMWLALRARVETLVLFDGSGARALFSDFSAGEAWVDIDGIAPVPPIAWPNESFTPPVGGYLRVTWIPNRTGRIMIGSRGAQRRPGLLQIDVMARPNQNVAVALEIAGKVAAHFPTDLCMSAHGVNCRVTKAPDVAQPIADDAFLMVPVTVSVETYA